MIQLLNLVLVTVDKFMIIESFSISVLIMKRLGHVLQGVQIALLRVLLGLVNAIALILRTVIQ